MFIGGNDSNSVLNVLKTEMHLVKHIYITLKYHRKRKWYRQEQENSSFAVLQNYNSAYSSK